MDNKGRKIKLAKYLAANHKTGTTGSITEIREAMDIVDEISKDLFGKTTKEMTDEEQDTFFTSCEKGTELENKATAA